MWTEDQKALARVALDMAASREQLDEVYFRLDVAGPDDGFDPRDLLAQDAPQMLSELTGGAYEPDVFEAYLQAWPGPDDVEANDSFSFFIGDLIALNPSVPIQAVTPMIEQAASYPTAGAFLFGLFSVNYGKGSLFSEMMSVERDLLGYVYLRQADAWGIWFRNQGDARGRDALAAPFLSSLEVLAGYVGFDQAIEFVRKWGIPRVADAIQKRVDKLNAELLQNFTIGKLKEFLNGSDENLFFRLSQAIERKHHIPSGHFGHPNHLDAYLDLLRFTQNVARRLEVPMPRAILEGVL